MRVVATTHIINGSGCLGLQGVTCSPGDTLELPEESAHEATRRGFVTIVEEPAPSPPIEQNEHDDLAPIEAAIIEAPERAVSRRGRRGRLIKEPDEQ